jgi:regulator of RNase E activity RraA
MTRVSDHILDFLRRTDTCTVSNAIETFDVRMRNEGYIQGTARSMFPAMPPVAGYAITGRIRTGAPPMSSRVYYQNPEWWEHVAALPGPKIIALADIDRAPGAGALFGEIHARIAIALGCVGYVTNGAIRDVTALEALGFHCFAGSVSISHAYAHIVDFGEPIEIGCMKINSGDLLHGDRHGVQRIPIEIAGELPAVTAKIKAHEAELFRLCEQPDFSIDKLSAALRRESTKIHNRDPHTP